MLLFHLVLFFCIFSIICSFFIVISKNPIHSILYSILVFCNVSFIFIILNIEFVALIFLIVYVGAIAVLFLFVVMMLNIKIIELDEVFWKYALLGCLISLLFLLELCYLIFNFSDFFTLGLNPTYSIKYIATKYDAGHRGWIQIFGVPEYFYIFIKNNDLAYSLFSIEKDITQTELLGWYVYTYSFYIFFILSFILLVAMVGSIILVLNQNVNIRRQLIFKQVFKNMKAAVVLKNLQK
jgi:NADH:ubiquinone oxidoreductase subunit 6 (subunit J)